MPNWCNNYIEINHADPAMLERVRTSFAKGELLQEFIPVPQELRDAVANFEKNDALIEKYGFSNWYDFSVANWGTKWDVGGEMPATDLDAGGLGLSFDSAWAPPIQAYGALEELGFEIKAYYYEPGMCFAGIYEDGNDDYHEYSSMSSDEVAEQFPKELDEMFCISESMAEWEEENSEE